MQRITGAYPGGPGRAADTPQGVHDVRIESSDARNARVRAGAVEHTRRRRARRVGIGFLVALLLAATTGLGLGLASHTTSEEIAAEQELEDGTPESMLLGERRRVLQELWRMEALEKAPTLQGGGP